MGFFGSICVIAKFSHVPSLRRENLTELSKEKITIHLRGAVKHPGIYTCDRGSCLNQLLRQVGLTKEADRKKIPFKKILFSPQTIYIFPKEQATKKFSLVEKNQF